MQPPFRVRTSGRISRVATHSTPGTHGDDFMLTVFLDGRGWYWNSADSRMVGRDTVGLVPPEDAGVLMADREEPYLHYYCRFGGDYARHLARRILERHGERFFACPLTHEVADLLRRMGNTRRVDLPDAMGENEFLLARALVMLSGAETDCAPVLSAGSITAYLREHMAEPHDLETMAEHFSMSRSGLCRAARRLLGRTIVDLGTEMKIDWAKTLLRPGSLNVAEVARRVGYDDAFYFSRVFKRVAGTSPKRWAMGETPRA